MLRRRLGRDPADPQRVLQGVYLVLGLGGVGVMGVLNLLDRQDSFGYASMMMVTNFLYYLPSRTRWTVNGLCLLVALAAVLQIAAGTGLFGHILVNQIIMSTVFAALAGSALHLQQLRAIRSEQQLAALVRSDALTGLASRAHVQAVLGDALEARAGTPMPVSVLLLDLDRFKSVNDLFGHNMGDTVLRAVAAGLYDHLPQGMVCGRWGGEEFLVVCPGIALPEAAALAERLRVRVGQLDLPPVERCSASFGVAEAQPDESPEHLVGRADAGLYAAKQAGRDRVVVVEHAAH
jgi:diguanylate cyclase (GGDEF)-like protein